MRIELLEFLVCPKCRNDLNLLPKYTGSEEDVIEGDIDEPKQNHRNKDS